MIVMTDPPMNPGPFGSTFRKVENSYTKNQMGRLQITTGIAMTRIQRPRFIILNCSTSSLNKFAEIAGRCSLFPA